MITLTGPQVHEDAIRKARYGHRDWLCWVDRKGEKHAALRSYDSLKAALLATGTQGRFTMYCASDGMALNVTWRVGIIMLRNLKWWSR